MSQGTERKRSYAGAAWNELMVNETKESLAELCLDLTDEVQELRASLDHMVTPYIDSDLEEVTKPLDDMTDHEYAQYCEYSATCPCQRCWETGYVIRLRYALNQSVKRQSHYATLLNDADGGTRRVFTSGYDWYKRLVEIGELVPGGVGRAVKEDPEAT